MMTLRYRIAGLALLALTMTTVDAAPPENDSLAAKPGDVNTAVDSKSHIDDPAFDRFVHHRALAEAWTELDPTGITDGVLQTLEAERVLGRPEPNLPAQQLVSLAVRLALENHDRSSLDRLEKGAAQANRPELVTAIVVARKTAGPSRTGSVLAPVTPEDTDVATFAAYRAFVHDIQAARLCGDARGLAAIASDLDRVPQFTDAQRESLREHVKEAASLAGEATGLPDAMSQLVSESRGYKVHWQGINSGIRSTQDNNTSSFGIVKTTPARKPVATGPALGRQQQAGQASGGFQSLSYEQRQAAIRLLQNPNGIKPTFARPRP